MVQPEVYTDSSYSMYNEIQLNQRCSTEKHRQGTEAEQQRDMGYWDALGCTGVAGKRWAQPGTRDPTAANHPPTVH